MPTIPLNGNSPLGYRITTTDRTGDATGYPNGFILLNQTNGTVCTVSGGTLVDGSWTGGTWASGGTFPTDLLGEWNNTIPGVGGPGIGYSVSTTPRTGNATSYPNGFLHLNLTDGSSSEVSGGTLVDGSWTGGTWTTGVTFPIALYTAWSESEGLSYVQTDPFTNQRNITGTARIG